MGRRNVLIKKSYENEKIGVVINPFLFEKEAELIQHVRRSKQETY
jgi:hypothetical protein